MSHYPIPVPLAGLPCTLSHQCMHTRMYACNIICFIEPIVHCPVFILCILQVDRSNYGKSVSQVEEGQECNSAQLIAKLAKFIYNYPGIDLGPIKTRAVLCHIYHHALHNRWFEARDLMLMSHLQEGIQHADVPTQVPEYENESMRMKV